MDLSDPTTLALIASEALADAGVEHAVYGGLALAAWGTPRETKDADFAVVGADLVRICSAFARRRAEVAVTFEAMAFGGLFISRLAVLAVPDVGGLNTVDLVQPRSRRYGAAALARALDAPLRHRAVRLIAPEDYIIFKALSTRDRDLDDAASVWGRNAGRLDVACIHEEARLLADEWDGHDVLGRLRVIVERGGHGG